MNTAKQICACEEHRSGLQVLNNYDPTRTTTLRNQFASEMGKRFAKIRGLIRQAIVDQDVFGLKRQSVYAVGVPGHRAFDFPTSAQKLAAFEDWLQEQVDAGIFEMSIGSQIGSGANDQWTDRYITTAYQKGVVRARNEMRAAGMDVPAFETDGDLQAAFNQPFHLDRVGLISTRTYSDLRGITTAMDTQISRVLGQGIADGDGPMKLAQLLTKTISGPVGNLSLTDTLGRFIPAERRAKILARTEIIRAHHAATMQEYKNWGLEGVKVKAEWTTAGDGRVCAACSALQGKVYTLKEMENKIPLHPQCRCIALPVVEDEVVGETSKTESRDMRLPLEDSGNSAGIVKQITRGKVPSAQIDELFPKLKKEGFYLSDYQKRWLQEGTVHLEDVPITLPYEWEYTPPLSAETPGVQNMLADFRKGYRFPVIEGFYDDDGKIRVADGQHRLICQKILGKKRIKVLITN